MQNDENERKMKGFFLCVSFGALPSFIFSGCCFFLLAIGALSIMFFPFGVVSSAVKKKKKNPGVTIIMCVFVILVLLPGNS